MPQISPECIECECMQTTAAASSSTAVVQETLYTTLAEWTEGTRPGSTEWIQALRAHAHPPTGWAAEWINLPKPKPKPTP